jgi:putative membrane protein
MYLFAYVSDLVARDVINTSFIGPLQTAILELQKAMTDLDKLASTPIPSAYSLHLKFTVWAYLLFLPFQLQQYIGWVTIPATAIAACIYLGFLEIGQQIEMPFAYDQSDLDLDKFVLRIAHQLAEVTAVSHIPEET